MDGVIHGSRTNQPPKFTPRTFSPPKLNFSGSSRLSIDLEGRSQHHNPSSMIPREAHIIGLAGALLPKLASSATAAMAAVKTMLAILESLWIWSVMVLVQRAKLSARP